MHQSANGLWLLRPLEELVLPAPSPACVVAGPSPIAWVMVPTRLVPASREPRARPPTALALVRRWLRWW